MNRIPIVRCQAKNGALLVREGLNITFYLRQAHEDVVQAMLASLETYLRAVGPNVLGWYPDLEGDWQELDAKGWDTIRQNAMRGSPHLLLSDTPGGASQYAFEYYGKSPHTPWVIQKPDAVCAVEFFLPTNILEEQGSGWVRKLAFELAVLLPFASGHAGLAFSALTQLVGVSRWIQPQRTRYPGMYVPELEDCSWHLGTRVPDVNWLTFLGPPVLEALGGTSSLRARLTSPDTSVQALDSERAVVTLGAWPDAGDTEQGHPLPLHRELARVLEPWLYRRRYFGHDPEEEAELRRFERRFLD
jgi:hypothetical protein